MTKQVIHSEIAYFRWNWIYKISGAAALISGILLLIAIINLLTRAFQPQTTNGPLTSLQNNWLIVIFKLLAGFSDVQISLLHGLNVLDIAFLALVGTINIGLYNILRRTSKIWSIIALVQPFLGIFIFIATKTAGRSTVMGVGLVSSIVMLRSDIFNKETAYIGILASVLLFVGDFSAGIPPNNIIAALFGIGYVLLIIWFFLIARKFFQLDSDILKKQV